MAKSQSADGSSITDNLGQDLKNEKEKGYKPHMEQLLSN